MNFQSKRNIFSDLIFLGHPDAYAILNGSSKYPDLSGLVKFYDCPHTGVLVEAEVYGLPPQGDCKNCFYGFHLHEYGDCSDHFENTGGHWNPEGHPHPHHAGDFPPLLGNSGYAYSVFFDDKLEISSIRGRAVIVHAQRDDFTSQPSGDSGAKIGCGTVISVNSAP